MRQYGVSGTLLALLIIFLSYGKQRVVGQHSSRADVLTIKYEKKFADDTFLFSTVTDATLSNCHLNNDLSKINDCEKSVSIQTVQNPPMKSSVKKKKKK